MISEAETINPGSSEVNAHWKEIQVDEAMHKEQ